MFIKKMKLLRNFNRCKKKCNLVFAIKLYGKTIIAGIVPFEKLSSFSNYIRRFIIFVFSILFIYFFYGFNKSNLITLFIKVTTSTGPE